MVREHLIVNLETSLSTCRPNPLIGALVVLFPPWTCCFQKRSRGSFYKTNRCGRVPTLEANVGRTHMGRFGSFFFFRLAVGLRPGRLVIWGLTKTQQKTRDTSPKTWRNWTKNLETYPEKHSPQLQKTPAHTVDGFIHQTTIWDVYKTPCKCWEKLSTSDWC